MSDSAAGSVKGYAPGGKDSGVVKSKGTAKLPILDGEALPLGTRKPEWLKVRSPGGRNYLRLKQMMRGLKLHSVCEEAGCPNMGECWESGTATFLILGDVCTRACKYCAIAHGMPTELDTDEPRRVAEAVAQLELEHVVITSVNRDELPDGGAAIFAETIRLCREARPAMSIEVLIPDFKGDEDALRLVVEARPDILNHNLETVERLYPWARPGGRYWRSISFLGAAKRIDPTMLTKSGVIVGMGETNEEIRQAMADLRKAGVDIVTLGQYLRPTVHHTPVARWVTPQEFAEWKRIGERELGFAHVEAGPLVRSSYHAEKQARTATAGGVGEIREILEVDVPAPAEVIGGAALVQIVPARGSASPGDSRVEFGEPRRAAS
ncbi:MAG TPA: lipoyl synthase [Longimicrobiales bacterium]|nr:lipoyl synthase [Longimicrobiales bacterium]